MLRPQSQDRRRGKSLRHRPDVELARNLERLSRLGRVRLFHYDRGVSRHQHNAGESAIGLRTGDRIEPRGALGRRTRDGKKHQQDEKPAHSHRLVQITRVPHPHPLLSFLTYCGGGEMV